MDRCVYKSDAWVIRDGKKFPLKFDNENSCVIVRGVEDDSTFVVFVEGLTPKREDVKNPRLSRILLFSSIFCWRLNNKDIVWP